jgi:hypothetical protein
MLMGYYYLSPTGHPYLLNSRTAKAIGRNPIAGPNGDAIENMVYGIWYRNTKCFLDMIAY